MPAVALYAGEAGTSSAEPFVLPPELARNRILRPREAAQFLGIAEQTMERWRAAGRGPRWVKLTGRTVGYRLADLEAYLEGRLSDPKSAA